MTRLPASNHLFPYVSQGRITAGDGHPRQWNHHIDDSPILPLPAQRRH